MSDRKERATGGGQGAAPARLIATLKVNPLGHEGRFGLRGVPGVYYLCVITDDDGHKKVCVCWDRQNRHYSKEMRQSSRSYWLYRLIMQHIGELYDPLHENAKPVIPDDCTERGKRWVWQA